MMAVQQCRPRIIGDEIDLNGAEARHVDRIFHDDPPVMERADSAPSPV
jgi:hypothetical protein